VQRVCERESCPLLKFTEQERHGLNMFKLIKMLAWLEGYLEFHWPVESLKPCMPSVIVLSCCLFMFVYYFNHITSFSEGGCLPHPIHTQSCGIVGA
jgi:hypothetical protein